MALLQECPGRKEGCLVIFEVEEIKKNASAHVKN
jgi:hypothetical protein